MWPLRLPAICWRRSHAQHLSHPATAFPSLSLPKPARCPRSSIHALLRFSKLVMTVPDAACLATQCSRITPAHARLASSLVPVRRFLGPYLCALHQCLYSCWSGLSWLLSTVRVTQSCCSSVLTSSSWKLCKDLYKRSVLGLWRQHVHEQRISSLWKRIAVAKSEGRRLGP